MTGNAYRFDRSKAVQNIQPPPLLHREHRGDWANIVDFSQLDFGRGMLTHPKYCIRESLLSHDTSLPPIDSPVSLTGLDNFVLTFSLKAYLKSRVVPHAGNWVLGLPPYSHSYALLLAYHLIMSHVSSSLANYEFGRFEPETGVLIVTDNIEVASSIWRANVNGAFLHDYIPVFSLEAGEFRPLQNGSTSKSRTSRDMVDGSLPWLGLFRAYRHELPQRLTQKPAVMILDLLPFRHRKRFVEILAWANQMADHVIAITPRYDDTFKVGVHQFPYVLPVDLHSINVLDDMVDLGLDDAEVDPVTASLSLQGSLPFLLDRNPDLHMCRFDFGDGFEALLKTTFGLISRINSTFPKRPRSVEFLYWVLLDLLSLTVPVEWYERTKRAQGEKTLLDRIESAKKIWSDDPEERAIIRFLVPELVGHVEQIYQILRNHKSSARGEVLENTLMEQLGGNRRAIVVVGDDANASELKFWLRSRGRFSLNDLKDISVLTQSTLAKEQLRTIYQKPAEIPRTWLLSGVWRRKYVGSFYIPKGSSLFMVSATYEEAIARQQLTQRFEVDNQVIEAMFNSLSELFSLDSTTGTSTSLSGGLNIDTKTYSVSPVGREFKSAESRTNPHLSLSPIIGVEVLRELVLSDHEDAIEDQHTRSPLAFSNESDTLDESVSCLRLKSTSLSNNNAYNFFIADGLPLRVIKAGGNEVEEMTPLEIQAGYIWVRVKQSERHELFQAVLESASNTMTMMWLQNNLDEWKEMLRSVWAKFSQGSYSRKNTYEKIAANVRAAGGTGVHWLTVKTWMTGEVTSVRDEVNVRAIAQLTEDERFIGRDRQIYAAMRRLWTIHIQLGKQLGKLIIQQATRGLESIPGESWIDLGEGIRIPVDDVIEVIDLHRIQLVERDKVYEVQSRFTNFGFSDSEIDTLLSRGLIKHG
ncbi:DrmE family protein [Ferroacidibacillus organovorans]|uniref:DISARM protein DrmE C-terminal domain-containing protein n=1 Tax=Ferroacidibacillus organovorans TaxID=1765683 RepID=A0A853KGN8_9BACL|nr:DrmE family protein [Ferroacidibacillus organovorans]KYP79948.1 hypothetical protein AYJ22_03370 [Ferroacidibacillus organovorans]OAG94570.1 hypothetical protein AYW79_04215 [Ferroacidibacillus organovorans]